MEIGFDATVLTRPTTTGVERYTRELLHRIVAEAPQHRFLLSYFRGPRDPRLEVPAPHGNVEFHPIGSVPLRLYRSLYLRHVAPPFDLLSRGRADVFVFPDFVRWPVLTRRSIVVVHDLAYARSPKHVPEGTRGFLGPSVPRSITKANRVVAVSEFTKQELIATYDVEPERIAVVPNAVDHAHFRPRTPSEIEAVMRRFEIDRPYVLMTGTLEPRKNVAGLVEAFGSLPSPLRETHALVLAGGAGWMDDGIHDTIDRVRRAGFRVIQTGYVGTSELPALYSGADLFVLPSHYEGFGIPVLEAMACGTPVITSSTTSLPEVAGGAAILVSPDDSAELATAIQKVLVASGPRDELIQRGLARAGEFSWDVSARAMIELIEQVAAER